MFQKLCSVFPGFRRDKNKLQYVKIAVSGNPECLVVSFSGGISGILKTLESNFNTEETIVGLFHSIDYQDPDYQDPDYQDPDYQDPDYQDPDYQDPDYQDPDYHGSNSGTDIDYEIIWDPKTGSWNLKSFK